MAAPCRAHDKKHFPGADVVRVGSLRWLTQPQHKETLDELVAEAAGFVEARRGVAFDELVREYEKHEPRLTVGDAHAYLLYGRPGGLFLDDGELKMDIKGVLYRPVVRRSRRTVTVEL